MNIIRLCGGLGNQLFQYAFGKEMTLRDTDVYYNTDWYTSMKDPNRPYLLGKFDTIVKLRPLNTHRRTIKETILNPELLDIDGYYFSGYWQSLLYFEHVVNTLKREISLKKEYYTPEYFALKKSIQESNSIALHVRRGDYLKTNRHYVQPFEYYSKALKFITSLKKDCKIFVFSDDLPWCKIHFSNVEFVELNDCCLEFDVMKFCKHFITSNSTFSYWPAFLNDNPSKIVITPKIWCIHESDQVTLDNKQFFPVNWIKL
jgi:hypothetical protein